MPTDFKPKRRTDKDTIAYAEFVGLRNDIALESFESSDLAVANNVIIDKARRIKRRAGATRRGAGAVHSLWSSADLALCVINGTLNTLSAALAPTALRTGITGTVSCARVNEDVFYSDSTKTGVIRAGADLTWGLTIPVMATPTLTAGDLVPGTYGFCATYVRGDGQESGASEPQFLAIGAGQSALINVAPSADPSVVMKNIYATTPDGDALFLVGQVGNGIAYTPRAADITNANLPCETLHMGPAPAGQLVAYYKGRMFVAVGDVLYPSEPYAYELFDLRKYIPFDGVITMLAPIEDRTGDSSGFFVGTTKSCGVLGGATPKDFTYTPKTEYGAIKGALAYVDGALYLDGSIGARAVPMWLTTQGICVGLPNLEVNNLTRSRYSFATSTTGGAAMFDASANMFICVSGPNPAVALHTENQTLTTFTNYTYNSFTRFADKNLAADGQGLHELVGDTDNGAQIAATVLTGITDFGSAYTKALDRLYVGLRSTVAMNATVKLEDGLSYNYAVAPPTTPMSSARVKTGKGLAARYWQFGVNNLNGADFTISTIDVKSAQLARRVNGRA